MAGPRRDLWVHGYWVWDYQDQYHAVERLDAAKKEVWPKPPYHFYGYHENARYRFLNAARGDSTARRMVSRPANGHPLLLAAGRLSRSRGRSFPLLGHPLFRLR